MKLGLNTPIASAAWQVMFMVMNKKPGLSKVEVAACILAGVIGRAHINDGHTLWMSLARK